MTTKRFASRKVVPIDAAMIAAWDRYILLMERAERTKLLQDGIAMGQARAAFLDLFLRDEARDKLGR